MCSRLNLTLSGAPASLSSNAIRFRNCLVELGFHRGIRRFAQRSGKRFLHGGAAYTLVSVGFDGQVARLIVNCDCDNL